MQILALLVAALLWLGVILWIQAKLDFRYRRYEENDNIEIELSTYRGLWKFNMSIPTVQLAWEDGPTIETTQETKAPTGEKRVGFQALKARYLRIGFLYELFPNIPSLLLEFKRVKKKFYRGIHCTSFDWKIEYGHENPATTALVAGSFWGMLGYSLARMYNQITVDTQEPRIMVTPQFKKPGFQCDLQCSFRLRIAHIMLVGWDLLLVVLRRILR
ncbi:MAG: DUF2953 domain-containing protein [Desulfitobacterium sp.]